MKYARIDSQGRMIFDDTSGQKGGKPIPANYVVRRLSDVKILPKSMQGNMKNDPAVTDIQYDNQTSDSNSDPEMTSREAYSTVHSTMAKQVIDLDDGLMDDNLNSVPYTDDIQYDRSTKALDSFATSSDEISRDEADNTDSDSKGAGDAKTPLPKPKKPPNLPS